MNGSIIRFIFKQIIFGFFSLLFLLIVSCSDSPDYTPSKTPLNLIEYYGSSMTLCGQQTIIFNDSLIIKRHIGKGWKFRETESRNLFPWPYLTDTSGQIHFKWKQNIDRRIAIKLLNIKPDLPDDFFQITINHIPAIRLPHASTPDRYEFFIPASSQKKGHNLIEMSIKHELIPSKPSDSYIALHSIILTHGAVIKTPIAHANEIRQSLMLAGPITIQFPIESIQQHVLKFDYSLIKTSTSGKPINYQLIVSLADQVSSKLIKQYKIRISSDKASSVWNSKRLILPKTTSGKARLSFEFKPLAKRFRTTDYLAISEALLFTGKRRLLRNLHSNIPDMLFFTFSSVGANSLPAYGYQYGRTPCIDNLFQNGNQYANAFSPSNGNIPAIASIFSGQYPLEHGLYSEQSNPVFPKETFPALLKKFGYFPYAVIFDDIKNTKKYADFNGINRVYFSDDDMLSDSNLLSKYQLALNNHKSSSSPLFSWIHINLTLPEYNQIKPRFDLSNYGHAESLYDQLDLPMSDIRRLQTKLNGVKDVRNLHAIYDTTISILDRTVENIIRTHQQMRPGCKIVVSLTSTNGLYRSQHSNVFSSDSLSDEILHIPMFTGQIQPEQSSTGKIIPDLISSTRFATCFNGLLDKSISEKLKEKTSTLIDIQPNLILAEHSYRRIMMLRNNRWKFIHFFGEPYFRIASENLFDMKNNPQENLNYIAEHPQIRDKMLNTMLKLSRHQPLYPSPRIGLIEDARQILSSLDYAK